MNVYAISKKKKQNKYTREVFCCSLFFILLNNKIFMEWKKDNRNKLNKYIKIKNIIRTKNISK